MSTSRRAAKASTQDDAPSGAKGRLGSKHKSPAASSLKEKQNPKVKSVPSSDYANKNKQKLITLTPEEIELFQTIKKVENKKSSQEKTSDFKKNLEASRPSLSFHQNKKPVQKKTTDSTSNSEEKRSRSGSKSPENQESKPSIKKKKLVIAEEIEEERENEEAEEDQGKQPIKNAIELSVPDPLTNLIRDPNGRLTPRSNGYETSAKYQSAGKVSANTEEIVDGGKKPLKKDKSSAKSTTSNEEQFVQEKESLENNKIENMLDRILEDSQWDIQIDVQRIEKDDRYVMSQSLEINEGLEHKNEQNEKKSIGKAQKSQTMESIDSSKEPPRRKVLANNEQISGEKPKNRGFLEEDSEIINVIINSGPSQEDQEEEIHSSEFLGVKKSKGKEKNIFDRDDQKKKLQEWIEKNKQNTAQRLFSNESERMIIENEKGLEEELQETKNKKLNTDQNKTAYQEILSSEEEYDGKILIESDYESQKMAIEGFEASNSVQIIDTFHQTKKADIMNPKEFLEGEDSIKIIEAFILASELEIKKEKQAKEKITLNKSNELINQNEKKLPLLNTQTVLTQAHLTQDVLTQKNEQIQGSESDVGPKRDEQAGLDVSNDSFNQNNKKIPYKNTQYVATPLDRSVQENSKVGISEEKSIEVKNNEMNTSNIEPESRKEEEQNHHNTMEMEIEKAKEDSDENDVLDKIGDLEEISELMEITGVRVSGHLIESLEREEPQLNAPTQSNQYVESQELIGIPKHSKFDAILSSLEGDKNKAEEKPDQEHSEHSEMLDNIQELAEIEDMKNGENHNSPMNIEMGQDSEGENRDKVLQRIIEEDSEKNNSEDEERVIMPEGQTTVQNTTQERFTQPLSDFDQLYKHEATKEDSLPASQGRFISMEEEKNFEIEDPKIKVAEGSSKESSSESSHNIIEEAKESESSEGIMESTPERNPLNTQVVEDIIKNKESVETSQEGNVEIGDERNEREEIKQYEEEKDVESKEESVINQGVIIEEKSESYLELEPAEKEDEGRIESEGENKSIQEVYNQDKQNEELFQEDEVQPNEDFSDEEIRKLIEATEKEYEKEQAQKLQEINESPEEEEEVEVFVEPRQVQRPRREPQKSKPYQQDLIIDDIEDPLEDQPNEINYSKSYYPPPKNSYSAYEDWKLLEAMDYYVSKNGTEGLKSKKTWENIKDPFTKRRLLDGTRPPESMRNRIRRPLSVITEEDHKKIREWIKNHSEEEAKNSYCRFESVKPGEDKKFIGIFRNSNNKNYLPITNPKQNKTDKILNSDQTNKTKRIGGKVEQSFERNTNFDEDDDIESIQEDSTKFNHKKQPKPRENDDEIIWEESRQKDLTTITEELLRYEFDKSKKSSVQKISRKDEFLLKPLPPKSVNRSQGGMSYEPSVTVSERESIQYSHNNSIQQKQKVNKKRKEYGIEGKPILINESELKKAKPDKYFEQKSLLISEAFKSRRADGHFELPKNDIVICVNLDEQYRQYVLDDSNDSNENERFIFEKLSQLALKYSLPQEQINNLFHLLSNDFDDLEIYLRTKNENLLWQPSEDNDLLEGNQTALRYLKILKGEERIVRRRLYLIGE